MTTHPSSLALRVPKEAELIAHTIRREIVRGGLTQDDCPPSESELVERFGVSRTTVREVGAP